MADLKGTPVSSLQYRDGLLRQTTRQVPEEVPIAFSYRGSTHAVMMATPDNLEDFAVGFSLTEGIIEKAGDIVSIEPIEAGDGIDVQMTLVDETADALTARRRRMAGPVGCGLCGIESIEQATRQVKSVAETKLSLSLEAISEAIHLLSEGQILNRQTHAVHGAAFYLPGTPGALLALREDVGRHNALDKLTGAVLRAGKTGKDGVIVVTSRLSVEMVQKAAALGSPILIAISAPTALAIKTAEAAGMTLVAIARDRDFEVFTRPDRIATEGKKDVA